jgi:hypothetical protein
MCVDCALTSPRIAQADAGRQTPPRGGSIRKVIVRPARLASEMVVLQLNAGVIFAIVHDNLAWRSETLWEACVMHGASKCFWPRSFGVEVASLMIVMTSMVRVPCPALGLHIVILLVVLVVHLGF